MGPLNGIKIIEIAGLGPGPFAGMMLADMGADVVLVERTAMDVHIPDCNRRGKRSIALNLKDKNEVSTLLQLIEQADVLFEGFRPGVMERLGLGPDDCFKVNPRLIYGRMTGWGQEGPLAHAAGHDINYISLTGSLAATGHPSHPPRPALNLVGDYGGGALFLVTGILAALVEVQKSGKGQVVDAAMTDGSALLMSIFYTLDGMGLWSPDRGRNMLDGGAHYYNCYETKDGKYVSIGAIEPQFYKLFIELLELPSEEYADQNKAPNWEEKKLKLEKVFKTKTRDEWCAILEGTDVCFAPVLDYREAPRHPHNEIRKSYIQLDGITQPAPAPRFSRTPSQVEDGSPKPGGNKSEILKDWLA